MQPRHAAGRVGQRQKAIVVDLPRPEVGGSMAIGETEVAHEPARQIDEVRTLVDEFAAPGDRAVETPFLLIADTAAVTVAPANEQERADRAVIGERFRACDGRMK